ncbi:MAG: hypothetical protein IAE80_25310 [Anaerolinea sp.]|nr:hypothetical protein [Anaerolinea sp.]
MITFDRTVTIDAPPRIVLRMIHQIAPPQHEDRAQHVLAVRANGLWNVFYWQPEGRRRTYLRYIVTPTADAFWIASSSTNLIRALDNLTLPISPTAREMAYGRLNWIVERSQTTYADHQKTLRSGLLKITAVVAVAVSILVSQTRQQANNLTAVPRSTRYVPRPTATTPFNGSPIIVVPPNVPIAVTQRDGFAYSLADHWLFGDDYPQHSLGCFFTSEITCIDQLQHAQGDFYVSFSTLRLAQTPTESLSGMMTFYQRILEARGVVFDVVETADRMINDHVAGVLNGALNDQSAAVMIVALRLDVDRVLLFVADGTSSSLDLYRQDIQRLVGSIRVDYRP